VKKRTKLWILWKRKDHLFWLCMDRTTTFLF